MLYIQLTPLNSTILLYSVIRINIILATNDLITISNFEQSSCGSGQSIQPQRTVEVIAARSNIECAVKCNNHSACSSSKFITNLDGSKECVLENDDYGTCGDNVGNEKSTQYHKKSTLCSNGGTYMNSGCVCPRQFTGRMCEVDIAASDECSTNPCFHDGTCTDFWRDYSCMCPTDVTGIQCETDLCPDSSCESYCHNGGTCSCSEGALSCACPQDIIGEQCETDLCPEDVCDSHCDYTGAKSCSCSNGVLQCDCIAGVTGTTCSALGRITDDLLYVTNGFYTGDWDPVDFCDATTYAYAFNQRVDDDTWDEVSVCEIKLYCKHPIHGGASSNNPNSNYVIADWGDWDGVTYCPSNYFIVSFRLFVEPGGGDDSAVNNMEVLCRGPGIEGTDTQVRTGTGLEFGDGATWGSWSNTCPVGMAVCGIQTKVLQSVGAFNDDDGLTDAKLQCCEY